MVDAIRFVLQDHGFRAGEHTVGYRPSTQVKEGVAQFVDWYREYYGAPGPAIRLPIEQINRLLD